MSPLDTVYWRFYKLTNNMEEKEQIQALQKQVDLLKNRVSNLGYEMQMSIREQMLHTGVTDVFAFTTLQLCFSQFLVNQMGDDYDGMRRYIDGLIKQSSASVTEGYLQSIMEKIEKEHQEHGKKSGKSETDVKASIEADCEVVKRTVESFLSMNAHRFKNMLLASVEYIENAPPISDRNNVSNNEEGETKSG